MLSQDRINRQTELRERRRRETLAPSSRVNLPVALWTGLAKDLDQLLLDIDQPGLGDAEASVKRHLHLSIIACRAFHHLYRQHDILGNGVSLSIEIGPGFQERQVRLRLRMLPQMDGVLHAKDDLPLQL